MVTVVGMIVTIAAMVVISLFLVGSLVRSIRQESRQSGITKKWKNFGLSITFAILFFASWAVQGVAQWQEYVNEQHQHHEAATVSDFIPSFSEATLENWQSEFLQLFSFVVLSALLIHRGSAESKDSEDRMEESLKRIEKRLDEISK